MRGDLTQREFNRIQTNCARAFLLIVVILCCLYKPSLTVTLNFSKKPTGLVTWLTYTMTSDSSSMVRVTSSMTVDGLLFTRMVIHLACVPDPGI